MHYLTVELKIKYFYLMLLVWIILFTSACAGPRVANDLLVPTVQNNRPLFENAVIVSTEINPIINNYGKIDEILKESLELALKNSNIFGKNLSNPYSIKANVFLFSQPERSVSDFKGMLEVNYILFDDNKTEILNKTIHTEAGSDKWSLSGAKTYTRARAVNIAKNVTQFVEILQSTFGK